MATRVERADRGATLSASLALVEAVAPPHRHDTFSGREQTLAKLDDALALLLEVRHIQEAKQIHDLAKAARIYAREQGFGREVKLKAKAIEYEALRKIGELLYHTDRAVGGRPAAITPSDSEGVIPTLDQLGIRYKTSSLAQKLYALSPLDFAYVRESRKTLAQVGAAAKRAADTQATIDLIDQRGGPDAADLRVCSCAELFATGIRPDVVITEPPGGAEHLHLFSELARACVDVPLVAVQMDRNCLFLPEVLRRLCEHLTYRGADMSDDRRTLVFCQDDAAFEQAKARPVPGPTTLRPCLTRDEYLVQRLTDPGGLVCDPFLQPATAIAALEFGRRFVGCHVDPGVIADTRRRIGAVR